MSWRRSVQHPHFLSIKGSNDSFWLRALNRSGGWPWMMLFTLRTLFPCLGSARKASNSLVLARLRINSEWAILVWLYWEIISSSIRCSCCKLMVFITLGGSHLLDGLVACGSIEACKKIVWFSGEGFVRGTVLTPLGSWRATLVERDAKGDK